MSEAALESLAQVVRESGLIEARSRGVVLVSGGADSTAAAAGLRQACGAANVTALHLDYGLREDSEMDVAGCRQLCALLRIDLHVERAQLGEGNVQAAARDARYQAAERLRERMGADWIATGHTSTDLAETMIYRLVSSPGSRALLGLRPRRGRVVRPLLAISRERARSLVVQAGLPFRDDPSNAAPIYARNRIRNEVLPPLREIAPELERTIAETRAELAEDAAALDAIAATALESAGAAEGTVPAEGLSDLPAALRRLSLRRLAEAVAGRQVALGRRSAAEIMRLARSPEGGVVELGGGLEARIEYGHIRFAVAELGPPEQARLSVPGAARFGGWEVRAELKDPPEEPAGPDVAVLDPAELGGELVVRSWREGDRMRPLGLDGSKSLQDVFSDRKVPRSLRQVLPVVTSRERIAWVAGVAVSEEFRLRPSSERAAVLSAARRSA
jgi:tRNA(Ile)-lysidine synthase